MKKFMKIMLILAAVFAAVGIGLTVGGIALGTTRENVNPVQLVRKALIDASHVWDNEWDGIRIRDKGSHDYKDDRDDWENENTGDDDFDGCVETGTGDTTASEFADITELEIDLKSDELVFASYTGDNIEVKVKNDPEGTVKIKKDSDHKLQIKSGKVRSNRTVTVYYPETLKFKKLDIEIEAGTVELMDRLSAEELKLSVGAGEFLNSRVLKADKFDIQVGVGSAEVCQLISNKVDGECGIGNISLELAGNEEDYNYRLECGIGEINLANEGYSGLGKEKVLKNPGASKEVDLECGMGNISVSFTGENPADMLKTEV